MTANKFPLKNGASGTRYLVKQTLVRILCINKMHGVDKKINLYYNRRMKKITIHDVAREAGVSAATVSYVINDKKGKTISEETKNKVWQIVNLYNYKPGAFAKNLRSSPNSRLISVYSGNDSNALYLAEFQYFLNKLREVFPIDEYNLVLSGLPIRKLDNVDGIIYYGADRESFFSVANQNYVPLLSVDCDVKDVLFYQVRTDYEKLKTDADARFKGKNYTYLTVPVKDDTVLDTIKNTFTDVKYIESMQDLFEFAKSLNKAENVVTDSKTIADFLSGLNVDLMRADNIIEEKCKTLLTMFNLASQKDSSDAKHDYFV